MIAEVLLPTRKDFLLAIGGVSIAGAGPGASAAGKVLLVVAHPNDEYACAASVYRLVRERRWAADQVIVTNGEAGYRYSTLAEVVYGVSLVREADGGAHLPAIRREEAVRAGACWESAINISAAKKIPVSQRMRPQRMRARATAPGFGRRCPA
jgi:hypothetical protein